MYSCMISCVQIVDHKYVQIEQNMVELHIFDATKFISIVNRIPYGI